MNIVDHGARDNPLFSNMKSIYTAVDCNSEYFSGKRVKVRYVKANKPECLRYLPS